MSPGEAVEGSSEADTCVGSGVGGFLTIRADRDKGQASLTTPDWAGTL